MYSKLQVALETAMREKNDLTKTVVRNIKAQVEKKQEEVVMREKPTDAAASKKECPSDEIVLAAIRKEAKELTKAIKEFPPEHSLVKEYKDQLNVCLNFLPVIDHDEKAISIAVDVAIAEVSKMVFKNDSAKVGNIIGRVMRSNKEFPGSMVKRIVHMKVGVAE